MGESGSLSLVHPSFFSAEELHQICPGDEKNEANDCCKSNQMDGVFNFVGDFFAKEEELEEDEKQSAAIQSWNWEDVDDCKRD